MKWDDVTGRADWISCDMLSNAADQAAVYRSELYKGTAGCAAEFP